MFKNRAAGLFLSLAVPAAGSFLLPEPFGSPGPNPVAVTGAIAATLVALTAGAWYARRWAVARLVLIWLMVPTILSIMLADAMVALAIAQTWS